MLHGKKGSPFWLTSGVYNVKYEDFVCKLRRQRLIGKGVRLMKRRSIGRLVIEVNLKVGHGETTTLACVDASGSIVIPYAIKYVPLYA